MTKKLIKGATVVLPSGSAKASVLIDGECIAAIDPAIHTSADEVINAEGLYLLNPV